MLPQEFENYLYFLDFMISELSKELVSNPEKAKGVKGVLLALAECEKRRVLKVMYERIDMTREEYEACVDSVYKEVERKYQQHETPYP
jgi:hypothetical protein